ncbi:MAG: hypothetical protein EXQ71_11585 [Acidimicrobiia bacterium]|nr:hypothetical protein [Acidimicrobiia bacterium]
MMTREERVAGWRRVAGIGVALLGAAGLVALVLVGFGSSAAQGLSVGVGVVGVGLVMGGVMAFGRTTAIRRTAGVYARASEVERREAERLALGLLAAGIMFCLFALAIG